MELVRGIGVEAAERLIAIQSAGSCLTTEMGLANLAQNLAKNSGFVKLLSVRVAHTKNERASEVQPNATPAPAAKNRTRRAAV